MSVNKQANKKEILSTPKQEVLSIAEWSSIHYMYKRRLACIAYQTFHNVAPDDINNLFTKHETSYRFKRLFKIASKCVLNPTRYLILSLIVPALFGIAYLASLATPL